MRLHVAVFLIVATFLTMVTAGVLAVDSEMVMATAVPVLDRSFQKDEPVKRLLRAGASADENNEERGINLNILGLEGLTNRLKSSSQKQVAELLKSTHNPNEAFRLLKLDEVGDKLLSSPNFKILKKFVSKLNKKNPEAVMIKSLQAQYGDDKLARMLYEATLVKGTKKYATKLQNAQFEQWFERGIRPAHAPKTIFKFPNDFSWFRLSPLDSRVKARKAYTIYLVKNHFDWITKSPY